MPMSDPIYFKTTVPQNMKRHQANRWAINRSKYQAPLKSGINPKAQGIDPKEIPREPAEPEVPNLPAEPDEPDIEQPITARLGLKNKASHAALSILTESDGSEDPGSGLDTEFIKS